MQQAHRAALDGEVLQLDLVELKWASVSTKSMPQAASIGPCGIEMIKPHRLHHRPRQLQLDLVELKFQYGVGLSAQVFGFNWTLWN